MNKCILNFNKPISRKNDDLLSMHYIFTHFFSKFIIEIE